MTNFAYLRVSTGSQDVNNQKLGILDYANAKNISPLSFIEDTESRSVSWKTRKIGIILNEAKEGDIIIASEVSRMAGNPLQMLEISELAVKKGVEIHITKTNMILDGTLPSNILLTILGLAAQIEREFISSRTKEALEKCKREGKKLGRPSGTTGKLMLDKHHETIVDYLKKGVSKSSIAKIFDCSRPTINSWIKKRRIKTMY